MQNAQTSQRLEFIKSVLALVALLAAIDISLMSLMTDYWAQPISTRTKAGVLGYEVMVLSVATIVLAVPAYLIGRYFGFAIAKLALIALTLPAIIVLILGWSFYGFFEKFIGLYAIQMLMQDGQQLMQFVGKMPSTMDKGMIASGILLFIAIILCVVPSGNLARMGRSLFASLGCLVVAAAAITSSMWNQPEQGTQFKSDNVTAMMERIRETEYLTLTSKSGPYTEMVSALSNTLFSSSPKLSIDTDQLTRRSRVDSSSVLPSPLEEKPNIVYILVESLHPNMLEAFGGNPEIMPTVNELGSSAYVFTNAWAQASHSNYADVSALSGQYPLRSMNIHFYPSDPTYPKSLPYDILAKHGYKSGLFSSQNEHWGLMSNYIDSDSVDLFSHVGSEPLKESGAYDGVKFGELNDGSGRTKLSYTDFMYQSSGNVIERLDEVTTGIAMDWIDTLKPEQPAFMYFNLQASHQPFNALPSDYTRKFLVSDDEEAEKVKAGGTSNVPIRYILEAYSDALHYVDLNIKSIVDHMKATGRHDNTIYVVSADTSIHISAGIIGNGGPLLPDVLHVPVIISTPGKKAQEIIATPMEQIDIMPTVFGIMGLEAHPASQGADALALRDPERVVYAVAQSPAAHQYSAIYRNWQVVFDESTQSTQLTYVGRDSKGPKPQELSQNQIDWLLDKLSTWRQDQIAYYSDLSVHTQFNPPEFFSRNVTSGRPIDANTFVDSNQD